MRRKYITNQQFYIKIQKEGITMGGRGTASTQAQRHTLHKTKSKLSGGGNGNNHATQTKVLSNADLKSVSDSTLKKNLTKLVKEYYSSGKSGISFGDRNIDDVVKSMMGQKRSRASMVKDYKAIKKAMGYK